MKLQKFSGFSLAEVLITLGIVGIVAAITIPSLMNNIQDAQYKSALKKSYSALNQASISIATDNGGTMAGYNAYPHISPLADDNSEYFMEAYLPYVNPVKICYTGDITCTKGAESDYKTYNGSAWPAGWAFAPASRPGFVLKDGSIWYFWSAATNCDNNRITDKNNCCGHIRVDTNGIKGPNTTTKDFWEFEIGSEGRVVPMGSSADAFKSNYAVTFGYNPILINWLSGG